MKIKALKKIINGLLSYSDLRLVNNSSYQKILESKKRLDSLGFCINYNESIIGQYCAKKSFSKSQLKQDLFVLCETDFKRNGFFVEFGATNGIDLSNTYLLEKEFGWQGILAEPGRNWHEALFKNRSCEIETKCIYSSTGRNILFHEVDMPELSTISEYSSQDYHSQFRRNTKEYRVKTLSLNDLLTIHQAPIEIDYISLDTEGSEYEILKGFDFSKYKIKVLTIEHNYTASRELIYELMISNGYHRVFQNYSMFDDWYVLKDLC